MQVVSFLVGLFVGVLLGAVVATAVSELKILDMEQELEDLRLFRGRELGDGRAMFDFEGPYGPEGA